MIQCLFCKIVGELIPAEKVAESESFIAIKDIHPKAPVHILIIPKSHREQPEELNRQEKDEIFQFASQVAGEADIAQTGFRLVFNVGKDSGQEIEHLHLHLIGGRSSRNMY